MLPFIPPLYGRRGHPQLSAYVGSSIRGGTAGPGALTLPAGVLASDFLVVYGATADVTITGGAGVAWNTIVHTGPAASLRFRRLVPLDLVNPLTLSGDDVVCAAYRGPRSMALRGQSIDTGNPSIPGFTKARNSAGVLGAGSWGVNQFVAESWPAPFVHRVRGDHSNEGGRWRTLWDVVDPRNYTDGTSVTVPAAGVTLQHYTILCELLF